ncbi:unnamed protein product [Rotaria sp. Silwood1]|nr:unnamed protein product [Rotaria sp. Silwood1]
MSIIGGTKNFSLTDRLELKFLNSIINICIKSKVWMITNGFDTGIVQLVGRAIKKAQLKQSDKVIAIGICKWGSIKDVKALTKQKDPYISETLDKNDDDHKVKSGECYLEMNHTHYLIPRDLFKDYNEELEIDLKNILYGDNDLQKRKGLNSKIAKEKDERKLTDALNQVRYCLQPAVRSLITVFNLNSATDLSDQIFETLEISRDNGEKRNSKQNNNTFNSNRKKKNFMIVEPVSFLELAMDWDCIHVAKEFVLKDSLANIPNLEEAFIRALDKNLPAFVYEFLRLGIEPAEVLFPPIKLSSGQCRYKKVSGKCLSRGCSDKYDDHDINRACNIVLQQNELYGYVTCLQVASNANDKLFISAPSCIEAMINVLYDTLYPEQTSKTNRLSLFIGFISLGILAPELVQYREMEMDKEIGESLKPTLEPHGINYSDPYPLEYPRRIKVMPVLSRYICRSENFHLCVLTKYFYHFACI